MFLSKIENVAVRLSFEAQTILLAQAFERVNRHSELTQFHTCFEWKTFMLLKTCSILFL